MDKKRYRVLDGANLDLFPRGTKVGDIVHLTDGAALYERDMGRIGSPDAPWPPKSAAPPSVPVEGETGADGGEAREGEAKEPAPPTEALADTKPRRGR